MTVDQGVEILRECETRLRDLVAVDAAAGEYEAVLRLTGWAKSIAAMASGTCGASPDTPAVECVATAAQVGNPDTGIGKASGRGALGVSRTAAARHSRKAARKRKSLRSAYPKFSRLKDELVKVGWSKRERKEYQHKAPRRVVDCLVDRLLAVGGNGAMFTTEDLLPLRDAADGTDVPSYQLYVCLAWLRHEKLVHQEGRQGYRLVDPSSLREAVAESWERLISRGR